MAILYKYTLRNVKKHKFRTFLIILSIILPVALFFSSLSVADALTYLIMDNIHSVYGNAELYANTNDNSGHIKIRDLDYELNNISYSIGSIEKHPDHLSKDNKYPESINLKGFNFEDIKKINPIVFEKFLGEEEFYGKSAIVGSTFAKEEGLKCGDFIKLQFNNDDIKRFRIVGIAKDTGFFKVSFNMGPRNATNIIVPLETLARFSGMPNMVDVIYFKMIDDTLVSETIEQLETVYKNSEISKLITQSEIDNQIKPIRIPFLFMLILVVMISIFIIYTSFKVIALERLPMLGTFRSVGATKLMTNIIMLSEAAIYAMFGSVIGCGLGHLFLNFMMKFLSMGMEVGKISYPFTNLIASFLFGVMLSLGSALIPIMKAAKLPIKEILLNIIEGTNKKNRGLKYTVGMVLVILSVVLSFVFSEGISSAIAGAIAIIFIIFAWVIFLPVITDSFIKLFENAIGSIFGNIGRLSIRNMRGNKSTYDNLVLISIGLSSMLIIGTLAQGITSDIMSYFDSKKYDIEVSAQDINQTTEQRVLSIQGVKNTGFYGQVYNAYRYEKNNVEGSFASCAYGFRNDKAVDFFEYDILDTYDDKSVIKSIFTGHNIIIGTSIRDEYNLKINQEITLKTDIGHVNYKIVGIIQTKEFNSKVALMSMQNLRHDYPYSLNERIVIKLVNGYDPIEVSNKIKEKFNSSYSWSYVTTVIEEKELNIKQNKSLFIIISAFSISTALIGSIGLMNNSLVNFLARKKDLAIYSSVGMSRKQSRVMLMLEAVLGGIIGGVLGIAISFFLLFKIRALIEKADVLIPLNLNGLSMIYGIIGSVLICLIASISVLVRSKHLSVIEILRYE